jgi:hypothetical protein
MPTNFDNLSAGQRHHLRYWTALSQYMERQGNFRVRLESPEPRYWIAFPKKLFGRKEIILLGAHNIIRSPKYISVLLHLSGPKAKQQFDSLYGEKSQIEKEIGTRLDWRRDRAVKYSEIVLERPNVDPEDERDWPRQHAWITQRLEDFYAVFAPRIERF